MPERPPVPPARRVRHAQQDPFWVRWTLTLLAAAVVGLLVVVPVVHVFVGALSGGLGAYWQNLFGDPDTRHSILLTLTVVPGALAANIAFGLAAAWAIARFRFRGRTLLTGFALAFARSLGEYGSVVFVSGNMPYKTEIAPVLIVARLEEFAYGEATAIAVVLLVISLALLVVINALDRWSRRSEAHA